MSAVIGKALFIHIPKTGGTFLRHSVIPSFKNSKSFRGSHADVKTALDIIECESGDINLVPFCFVRHPADFIYSHWKFAKNNPQISNLYEMFYNVGGSSYLLKEYIRPILEIIDIDNLKRTIKLFTNKHKGIVGELFDYYSKDCEFIGRQEELIEDFFNIMNKINYQDKDLNEKLRKEAYTYGKHNVSLTQEFLTREMLDDINKAEEYTIRKHKYEFK